MYRFPALRRLFTWIAVMAILGGVMAPAISPALAKSGGNGDTTSWLQVCTAHGIKLVLATDLQRENPPAQHSIQREHCPYCAHQASALPPGQNQPLLFPAIQAASHPLLFFSAPRPLFAWSAASPRAPPTLC